MVKDCCLKRDPPPSLVVSTDFVGMHVEVCAPSRVVCCKCKTIGGTTRLVECGGCDKWYHVGCIVAS